MFKGSFLKQDKATVTTPNVVNLIIVYDLDTWSRDLTKYFTLKDPLFGSVKLTTNPDQISIFILVMVLDLILIKFDVRL